MRTYTESEKSLGIELGSHLRHSLALVGLCRTRGEEGEGGGLCAASEGLCLGLGGASVIRNSPAKAAALYSRSQT